MTETPGDFEIPEEAVEQVAGELHGFEHDRLQSRCPGSDDCQLWYDAEIRAAWLLRALPHLRVPETRPVVDREALREQIAMKLSLVRFSDEESDRMIELTMREAWPLADAVLALLPTEAETKALAETATKLGYELGRKEALEGQLAQVEDAAHRWEVQQERWDIGTPEQRGKPHQVAMAWERNGELRCWAKHLRHAEELLDAPDITKGDS